MAITRNKLLVSVVAVVVGLAGASAGLPSGADQSQSGVLCSGGAQPCLHGAQLGNAVLQGPRRMLVQAAAPPKATPVPSPDELCSDHPPPGKYGCDEQRDFNKCFVDFMVAGDFCKRTCGRCQGHCNDIQPPGKYTCAEQKSFGKCEEHYIRDWGYCASTCERCDMNLAAVRPDAAGDAPSSDAGALVADSSAQDAPADSPTSGAQAAQSAATAGSMAAGAHQAAQEPPAAPVTKPFAKATDAPTAAPTLAPTHAPTAAPTKAPVPAPAHEHQDAATTKSGTAPPANVTHVVKHHGDDDGDDASAEHAAGGGTVVVHKHSIFAYVHGILMVSAFGVIIPLGVFTSRYGKAWKHWFNTHRAVQTIGWVVAAAGFVLALTMHKLADYVAEHQAQHAGRRLLHAGHDHVLHDAAWQRRHNIYLIHKYVGISVFVLVSLQVMSLFVRPGKKSGLRATWAWLHWAAGWGLLAAALFNNWEGLVLLQPLSNWYFIGYAALLAVIAGVVLVQEARRCIYGHQLEGYKQAGEDGGLEMVGGSKEERQGLTAADDGMDVNGGANGHRFDLAEDEDDEELAFATAKFAKD